YQLNPTAGGTGPTLKYQGAAVTIGQFDGYTPIGVETVSNGYEVAWKNAATGNYSVWSTDTNGNYTGNFYMPGPGTNASFEALETSFHQDLNGDGTIGVPSGANTYTPATVAGDGFVFGPAGHEQPDTLVTWTPEASVQQTLGALVGPITEAATHFAWSDGVLVVDGGAHQSTLLQELQSGFFLSH
ncbi:MAG: protease, partial [Bradyrhizobium guangdongense]